MLDPLEYLAEVLPPINEKKTNGKKTIGHATIRKNKKNDKKKGKGPGARPEPL